MIKFTKLNHLLPHLAIYEQSFRFFSTNNNNHPQKSYIPSPQSCQTKTIYLYEKPIHFKNGRYLLYMNKQNLITPYLLDLPYTVVMTYLAFLISRNPFYLTIPSALPMMLFTQFICRIQAIQYYIAGFNRVYLLNNGINIQIIYANKIRRYVKNNPDQTTHLISDFASNFEEDLKKQNVQPYKGTRFPSDPHLPFSKISQPSTLQYGWTTRDKDFNNFILPSHFQFINWQLLSKVMNGIMISTQTVTEEGIYDEKVYPTIEQQMENINKLNQQKVQNANEKTNIKTENGSADKEK